LPVREGEGGEMEVYSLQNERKKGSQNFSLSIHDEKGDVHGTLSRHEEGEKRGRDKVNSTTRFQITWKKGEKFHVPKGRVEISHSSSI